MRQINTDFCFHPVGQGCFYTGRFETAQNKIFNFVYDCGSNTTGPFLQNAIHNYKSSLDKNTIDMVIISHFDEDHVNGVFELLKGVTCTNLIIPYYSPIERLALYLKTSQIDDDYSRMLQNPIAFFDSDERFDISNIILVGGTDPYEESPEDESPEKEPPSDETENESFNLDGQLLSEEEHEKVLEEIKRYYKEEITSKKMRILRKPYIIKMYIWEFVFYLRKYDKILLIDSFSKDVDQILLQNKIGVAGLFDPNIIKQLKNRYRRWFAKNLNLTTLVVFHGPRNTCIWDVYMICNPCPYPYPYRFHCCYFDGTFSDLKLGTLLTGDADLSTSNKVNKMITYFTSFKCFDKIGLLQVPHHGSKYSWLDDVPNRLHDFLIYVINHGRTRQKHPALEVVNYINTNCTKGVLLFNTEINKLQFKVNILW